jgi:putative ABC transport system permease protein
VRIARDDIPGALEAIDAMWSRLTPSMPRSRRFLDEIFDESYETFGRINQLVTALALMAFFISIVGLLGMAIQVASRRRHEMGIRKTLGASARQIVGLMLKDFGKPVVIANLVAWPLAFLAANVYLSVFMHRIALTPLPFVLSLVLTLLVAWLTVSGQALKSSRVRPAEVLNCE